MMSLNEQLIQKRRKRINDKGRFLKSDYAYREIVDRLLERLDYVRIEPSKILVYGWQGDYDAQCLKTRYSNAKIQIIKSRHDLQVLQDDAIDLVVSNCALEWENEPKVVLQHFHRVLSDNGLLHFTTLGPGTAEQLRQSFLAMDDKPHVHTLTDMHHIGDCLKKLSFDNPVVDMEELILAYNQLSDIFSDLTNTASTNADINRAKGLMTKQRWQKMLSHYETLKIDDYYPFTLEIIYGHGWKVLCREVAVPVESIAIRQKTNDVDDDNN